MFYIMFFIKLIKKRVKKKKIFPCDFFMGHQIMHLEGRDLKRIRMHSNEELLIDLLDLSGAKPG